MHALCTLITERTDNIDRILDERCFTEDGDGEWDYAMVGGRYNNLIPIKKASKRLLDTPTEPEDIRLQHYDNRFVSVAKIRTIDTDTLNDMYSRLYLNPLNPYRLLIPDEGIDIEDIRQQDDEVATMILEYMKLHPTHIMVIVDYHY